MITFSCPRCATRYDVDDRLAGKKGRCKKCGHVMSIPAPSMMVAASGMFRLRSDASLARVAPRVPAPAAADAPRSAAPLFPSSVGLAPVSADFRPVGKGAPAADVNPRIAAFLHESTSGNPYALAEDRRPRYKPKVSGGKPAGVLTRLYRGQIGGVLTILRKVNDFAYLISIPFIVLLLVGIVLKSRPMALIGASAVILLNIGRFATGAFAFYVRPFKKSPIDGILFLIPPYTVYYVAAHWKSMKKSTMRFVEPALTVGVVFLAFVFIPWLSSGAAPEGATIEERIRAEAGAMKSDVRDELEGRGGSLDEALGGLTEKAQRGIEAVKGTVSQPPGSSTDQNSAPTEAPR